MFLVARDGRKTQSGKATAAINVRRENLRQKMCLDSRTMRVCRAHAIEPYLGEIRDSFGASVFV
jgi:hypothetical protein